MKNESRLTNYLLDCGIKLSWHSKRLDDFVNDDNALRQVKSYLDKSEEVIQRGLGLYLWGANGCGKSHLMNCTFKGLLSKGYKVHIFSIDEIVDKYTAGWYSDEDKRELDHVLRNSDFLGIDEFGKNVDKDGNPYYLPDLVKRVMESVIRFRVQMKKPIFFTSNTDPMYIKKVFNEDIASLLNEAVISIQVTGKDFRKTIYNENKKFIGK